MAAAGAPITTRGLVLRTTPYREADLVVTVYSRERGKLTAMARSARRSRKRFGAALGLLTVSTMTLVRGRGEMWTLQAADVADSFLPLAGDLAAFTHASYALELVRELTAAEQPDPELFDLVVELMHALGQRGASAGMLRAFELRLLDLCGLAPVLDRCVGCDRTELAGPDPLFDPVRGGVVCADCVAAARLESLDSPGRHPGAGRPRPLSAAARTILVRAQGAPALVVAGEQDTPGAAAREARDAMLALILAHIGKPLRSLEFLSKLSGARRDES